MDKEIINVFGATGFIGSNYCKLFTDCVIQEKNDRKPKTRNILYFISTVDNYNVFKDLTLDVDTNLKVFCELLENCKKGEFVINFISSWFVYGQTKMPVNEKSICNPKGFYSITKKTAEDLLISFCETFKQEYRILRLCNAVSVGDLKASKKKNALCHMIQLLKENKTVNLYDEGSPTRDLLHVSDICKAINLICNEGDINQIFNVGRGESTHIGYIVKRAKKILNSKSNINYIDAPEFHKIVQVKDFSMNTSKIKNLSFEPSYSVDEIIEELCLRIK